MIVVRGKMPGVTLCRCPSSPLNCARLTPVHTHLFPSHDNIIIYNYTYCIHFSIDFLSIEHNIIYICRTRAKPTALFTSITALELAPASR